MLFCQILALGCSAGGPLNYDREKPVIDQEPVRESATKPSAQAVTTSAATMPQRHCASSGRTSSTIT